MGSRQVSNTEAVRGPTLSLPGGNAMSIEQFDGAKITDRVRSSAIAVARDGQATLARHVLVLQSTPSYLTDVPGSGNISFRDASIVCSILLLHFGYRGAALCLLTRISKAE